MFLSCVVPSQHRNSGVEVDVHNFGLNLSACHILRELPSQTAVEEAPACSMLLWCGALHVTQEEGFDKLLFAEETS